MPSRGFHSTARTPSGGLHVRLTPLALVIPFLVHGVAWAQSSEDKHAEAAAPAADAASAAPAPVENSKTTPQEVVVTAERRGSTVQKTPISMTAVTGDTLQEKGISGAAGVARETAGVSIKSSGGGQTEYTMRGLSSTGGVAGTTGIYLDEVSVATPTTSAAGKIGINPDLYDLARVEVLRGPQGTLYGAGSMGGTLKLVPHEPEMNRFTGSAQVQGSQTVGGSASGSASVMVNLPVQTDVAAVRVVATRRHNGGYIDRVVVPDMPTADPTVNGSYFEGPRGDVKSVPASKVYKDVNSEDITQLRVSALIKPASGLTITPSVLYQKSKYGGEYSIDATPGDNAHYQPFDIAEPISSTLSLVSLKVNYELPDVTLTSVTAYAKQRMSQTQDTTEVGFEGIADTLGLTSYKSSQGGLGPISSTETNPTSQATQEIRLASKGQGPLQWIVGGYIGHFESTYHGRITAPEAAPLVGTTDYYGGDLGGSRTQYALFGNATYQFTPALRGTVGARAFRITDKFTGNDFGFFGSGQPADLTTGSNKGVNPMVNLAYTVTPDSMVYATASKGFREGSGQRGVPAAACATDLAALGRTDAPHHYNPDTVWNYEVGSKNRLFNRNMVFNVAVYQMNWDNVQKAIYLPTCGFVYTDNAAKAKVQGAEVELGARLSDTFQFEQSLGYTHARYSADNMASGTKKGDELDGVPTWNASSSLRYYKQISDDYSLLARLSAVYVGKYIDHSATVGQFGDYTMVNFRIGLDTDRWSGAVYVNNLTNKQARMGFQRSLSLSSPSTDRIVIDRPRTIGVELNYNW